MIRSLRTRRSRTPTRSTGIERKRRRNGRGAEGRSGWRLRRVSAGWIHSRDQAGRQSPAGHRSRAREGTRCVPAKKPPDDSRTAPMDEAFSTRFRCRASTGGKTCAAIGFRLAGKRGAASESMPGEARANRTGLVSVRLAIRASPRRDYHAAFRAADGRARLGGNAASPPPRPDLPAKLAPLGRICDIRPATCGEARDGASPDSHQRKSRALSKQLWGVPCWRFKKQSDYKEKPRKARAFQGLNGCGSLI